MSNTNDDQMLTELESDFDSVFEVAQQVERERPKASPCVTAAMAKELFIGGSVIGFAIERDKNAAWGGTREWQVLLTTKNHPEPRPLAGANTPRIPRSFRTLDAAVRALEAIGLDVPSLRG